MLQHHGNNEAKVYGWMPFLMPTLLLYPGLGLTEEYQKVNPQVELVLRIAKFNIINIFILNQLFLSFLITTIIIYIYSCSFFM